MSKKPSEMEYADYRAQVEIHGDSTIEQAEVEYDTDPDWHDAVWQSIDGCQLVNNYGYMLVTVLLSDQNPDQPMFCEPWTTYCDLSDPTWADAVSAMAYVCLYSDVFDYVQRKMEEDDE